MSGQCATIESLHLELSITQRFSLCSEGQIMHYSIRMVSFTERSSVLYSEVHCTHDKIMQLSIATSSAL